METLINLIKHLDNNRIKYFYTEWYINAYGVQCKLGVRGKERKKRAKILCNELNELINAIQEGRVKIEPKK